MRELEVVCWVPGERFELLAKALPWLSFRPHWFSLSFDRAKQEFRGQWRGLLGLRSVVVPVERVQELTIEAEEVVHSRARLLHFCVTYLDASGALQRTEATLEVQDFDTLADVRSLLVRMGATIAAPVDASALRTSARWLLPWFTERTPSEENPTHGFVLSRTKTTNAVEAHTLAENEPASVSVADTFRATPYASMALGVGSLHALWLLFAMLEAYGVMDTFFRWMRSLPAPLVLVLAVVLRGLVVFGLLRFPLYVLGELPFRKRVLRGGSWGVLFASAFFLVLLLFCNRISGALLFASHSFSRVEWGFFALLVLLFELSLLRWMQELSWSVERVPTSTE